MPKVLIALLILLALGAGAWWWQHKQQQEAQQRMAATATPAAAPDEAPPAAPAAPSGPQYPIEGEAEPDASEPAADAQTQLQQALTTALGASGVSSFLQLDGVVQRVVATVDNLPREHAPVRLWPVQPTPQRFSVQPAEGGLQIATANAQRYTPLVRFASSIDSARVVAVYKQFYPLFQQAYRELGYPDGHFNDRLVAVIDHLLQAPELATPPAVRLVDVKGAHPPAQPWTRYEFVDPQLEALSSGQKVLVRMGTANAQALKGQLRSLRAPLVAGATR